MPSIAVLPFDDMSPEQDQAYFCEGMAEEIINALTALDGLQVASRTSAFQAKAKDFEIAEIGTRLHVGTVLEGSVRKAGQRLRVTAQLINVSDGYHLWSERFDRDMEDVFAVQDEIARSVTDTLKVTLLGGRATPLVKQPTDNLDAYNLFLKGRYHFARLSRSAVAKSIDCFTEALVAEPTYAQAHASIGTAQATQAIIGFAAPRQVMPLAKQAARRALDLDDTVADGHVALAVVLEHFEWKWAEAERHYRRALGLNPADSLARGAYAVLLAIVGRSDAAVEEARQARERDPLSFLAHHHLALVLSIVRRYDEARVEAQAGIELEPNGPMLYVHLGRALAGQGQHEAAVDALRQATTVAPDDPMAQAAFGTALD